MKTTWTAVLKSRARSIYSKEWKTQLSAETESSRWALTLSGSPSSWIPLNSKLTWKITSYSRITNSWRSLEKSELVNRSSKKKSPRKSQDYQWNSATNLKTELHMGYISVSTGTRKMFQLEALNEWHKSPLGPQSIAEAKFLGLPRLKANLSSTSPKRKRKSQRVHHRLSSLTWEDQNSIETALTSLTGKGAS